MTILKHRKAVHTSARRLRRGRRLYVFLCRHALKQDDWEAANRVLRHMTLQMHNRQLYAQVLPINWRDWNYRIWRYLYNIEGGDRVFGRYGWDKWMAANGVNVARFQRCSRKLHIA